MAEIGDDLTDEEILKEDYTLRQDKPKKGIVVWGILIVVLVSAAFYSMRLFGPSYTGYVVTDVNKLTLNEMAFKESDFFISSRDGENIPIKSVKVSGSIHGEGDVSIYLDGPDDRKLIFSNSDEGFKMPLITGFAVSEVETDYVELESSLKVVLDDVSLEGEHNNALGGIRLRCEGNENGMYSQKMTISWSPNHGERFTGIEINNQPFWGEEETKGWSPSGTQPSGATVTGWDQTFPNNVFREINSIKFDSDMTDKQVTVEIFFHDYFTGFSIGQERKLKIFLDLSGQKESYVEEKGKSVQRFVLEKRVKPGGKSGSSGKSSEDGEEKASEQEKKAVEEEKEPGYDSVMETEDGKKLKTRALSSKDIQFESIPNRDIEFRVLENTEYKEIYETNPQQIGAEVFSECQETCFLDDMNRQEYQLSFEIDQGTAFNLESIDFS